MGYRPKRPGWLLRIVLRCGLVGALVGVWLPLQCNEGLLALAADMSPTDLSTAAIIASSSASYGVPAEGAADRIFPEKGSSPVAAEEAQKATQQEEDGEAEKIKKDSRARIPKSGGKARPVMFTGILIAVAVLLTAVAGVAVSRFVPKKPAAELWEEERDEAQLETLESVLPIVADLMSFDKSLEPKDVVCAYREHIHGAQKALQRARASPAGSLEASQSRQQARHHIKSGVKVLEELRDTVVVWTEELTSSILPLPPAKKWADGAEAAARENEFVAACAAYMRGLEKNSNDLWRRSRLPGRHVTAREQIHDVETMARILRSMAIDFKYLEKAAMANGRAWDTAIIIKHGALVPVKFLYLLERYERHQHLEADNELGIAAIPGPTSPSWRDMDPGVQEKKQKLNEKLLKEGIRARSLLAQHKTALAELEGLDTIAEIEAANERAQALEKSIEQLTAPLLQNFEAERQTGFGPEQIGGLRETIKTTAKQTLQLAETEADAIREIKENMEAVAAEDPGLKPSGASSLTKPSVMESLIYPRIQLSLKELSDIAARADNIMGSMRNRLTGLRKLMRIATPSRTEDIVTSSSILENATEESLELMGLRKEAEGISLEIEFLVYLRADIKSSIGVVNEILSFPFASPVTVAPHFLDLKEKFAAAVQAAETATTMEELATQAVAAQSLALQMEDVLYEIERAAAE